MDAIYKSHLNVTLTPKTILFYLNEDNNEIGNTVENLRNDFKALLPFLRLMMDDFGYVCEPHHAPT